jgi:hypothetical protein
VRFAPWQWGYPYDPLWLKWLATGDDEGALALPKETMRFQAIEGLLGGWSQANLETCALALKDLERGPLRDIAAFVANARWADRAAAVTWSLDFTSPAKRREVAMQQSRYWLNADREAATKWIEAEATSRITTGSSCQVSPSGFGLQTTETSG